MTTSKTNQSVNLFVQLTKKPTYICYLKAILKKKIQEVI